MSKKSSLDHNDSNYPKRILVPMDGSSNAKRALGVAIGIAKEYGARLVVLNVLYTPAWLLTPSPYGGPASALGYYYERQESAADNFLEDALTTAKSQGVTEITTKVTRATKSIVEDIIEVASSEKVDLIVIGTRGLGGFGKLLQGSVSSGVVAHAHCSVLVVR